MEQPKRRRFDPFGRYRFSKSSDKNKSCAKGINPKVSAPKETRVHQQYLYLSFSLTSSTGKKNVPFKPPGFQQKKPLAGRFIIPPTVGLNLQLKEARFQISHPKKTRIPSGKQT